MGFDKDYPNRKDWRRPYRDVRAIDATCRSHGSCPWCDGKRTHKKLKAIPADEAEQVLTVAKVIPEKPHRRYMHDKLLHRGDIYWDRSVE